MKPINVIRLAQAGREFAAAVRAREQADEALDAAYRAWKRDNEITVHIERGSEAWDAMMEATQHQYVARRNARRRESRRREKLVKIAEGVQA